MADRFTKAGDNIWLLPSSMAGETYKQGGMEFAIATVKGGGGYMGVKKYLKGVMDAAYVDAQAKLSHVRAQLGTLGKRFEQGVTVEKGVGQVDAYLILNDFNSGTPGAISIELGRGPYYVHMDGTGTDNDHASGDLSEGTYRVGGMEGVGILHAGFDMNPGSLEGTGGGDIPSGI